MHGSFNIKPDDHLKNGHQCNNCALIERQQKYKDEFIINAQKIHGNNFNYKNINYINSSTEVDIICNRCNKVNVITPHSHFHEEIGCSLCDRNSNAKVSKVESKWLDILGIQQKNRQVKIYIQGRSMPYTVDGYNPDMKICYEFNGDMWHGNPNRYNLDDQHPYGGIYRDYYTKTVEKRLALEKEGYEVISIWESDFYEIYR